jgi:hypothetical protein
VSKDEYTLTMNSYEAANLRWLMLATKHTALDTGDWCGMLRRKLEAMAIRGEGNDGDPERMRARLQALRSQALTAEEREALEYLRQFSGTSMRFMEGQSAAASDMMCRALSLLDRLKAGR